MLTDTFSEIPNSTVPYEEISAYLHDLATMPRVSPKEEQKIIQRIATAPHSADADKAREQLIDANLVIVVRLAVRYHPLGPALADLVQEGNIALMMAARRFDPQRSRSFRRFASQRVHWAFYNLTVEYLCQHHLIEDEEALPPIVPLSAAVLKAWTRAAIDEQALVMDLPEERLVSLDLLLKSTDTDALRPFDYFSAHAYGSKESDPDAVYLAWERHTSLGSALQSLPKRECLVLVHRFLKDQTLEEVGKRFKVTRERARQLEAKGIRMMRHPHIAHNLL